MNRSYTDGPMSAEGKKQQIVQYTNREGYVMKADRVVELVTSAPVVSIVLSDYKPSGSDHPENKEALFKGYGTERRFTQLGSTNDGPVGSLITKIQNEVSQTTKGSSGPLSSNWRSHPVSTGQDAVITTNMIKESNQKLSNVTTVGNQRIKEYSLYSRGTNPVISTNKPFYERPNDAVTATKAGNCGCIHWHKDLKVDSDLSVSDMVNQQQDYKKAASNKAARNWFEQSTSFPAISQQQALTMQTRQPKVISSDDLINKYFGANVPRSSSSSPFAQQPRFTVPSPQPKAINTEEMNKNNGHNLPSSTSFPSITQQPRFTVLPPQPKSINSHDSIKDHSVAHVPSSTSSPAISQQPVPQPPQSKGPINSQDLITKDNGPKVPSSNQPVQPQPQPKQAINSGDLINKDNGAKVPSTSVPAIPKQPISPPPQPKGAINSEDIINKDNGSKVPSTSFPANSQQPVAPPPQPKGAIYSQDLIRKDTGDKVPW